jgi:hypothetical protein
MSQQIGFEFLAFMAVVMTVIVIVDALWRRVKSKKPVTGCTRPQATRITKSH